MCSLNFLGTIILKNPLKLMRKSIAEPQFVGEVSAELLFILYANRFCANVEQG